MTEPGRSFEPTDPRVENDLLTPEPREAASEGEPPGEEAEAKEERSRDPRQYFGWVGWALVAVVAVLGVLMFAELIRISNGLNNAACIQRAQAHFLEAVGPGVTPQYAGLDRLVGDTQLAKCGQ